MVPRTTSVSNDHLRVFESTLASRLLALIAFWPIRLTFDLLFTTGQARLCESLSRLPCLGHAPIGIDWLPVHDLGLM